MKKQFFLYTLTLFLLHVPEVKCWFKKKIWSVPELTPTADTYPVDAMLEKLIKKTIRDMTIEELRQATEYAQKRNYTDLRIKYIERLITLTNDAQELCNLRLDLADLLFEMQDYKKSGKLYREYVKFYPGSQKRDYAEYKLILTKFYVRLQPPRDATITRKTIQLATRYLEYTTAPNRAFTKEIEKIRTTCYEELFQYDLYVVKHYLIKKSYNAALTRLKSSRETILPHLAHIEPTIIEYEGMIAQAKGDKETVTKLLATLKEQFPSHKCSLFLADSQHKKSYVTRF